MSNVMYRSGRIRSCYQGCSVGLEGMHILRFMWGEVSLLPASIWQASSKRGTLVALIRVPPHDLTYSSMHRCKLSLSAEAVLTGNELECQFRLKNLFMGHLESKA
jgi:hypothetical protein